MARMHEVLACEKTVLNARDKVLKETQGKFEKVDTYFKGHSKSLQMLSDTPQNQALERASREDKVVATSVYETLDYALALWAKAENLQIQKNEGNTRSKADIVFRGEVIMKDVPIDQIMGLEARITELRALINNVPTLDASKNWVADTNRGNGYYKEATTETRTKTEKQIDAKVLYPATVEHPAQVKEFSFDQIVGNFTTQNFSSAVTSRQKADMLAAIDDLIVSTKKARVAANQTEVSPVTDAEKIVKIILAPLAG